MLRSQSLEVVMAAGGTGRKTHPSTIDCSDHLAWNSIPERALQLLACYQADAIGREKIVLGRPLNNLHIC